MSEETLQNRIEHYNLLIPQIYQSGKFPNNFRLMPLDWALSEEVVRRESIDAVVDGIPQKIRPIGTMDVEFLSNSIVELAKHGVVDLSKSYPCGLKCPGCFSEDKVYSDKENLMRWQEVMKVIDGSREIGLTSIKFLGPGELFQNSDLFDILEATKQRNLPISIFTKGAELGDDELAKKAYGHLGIETAEELARRIAEYDNVRILLGFNSFFRKRQDNMVGSFNKTSNYEIIDGRFVNRGISDYTTKRDKALVNLVDAGFNSPEKGQRLSLIAAPVGLDQIEEIPEVYVWAAKRNIPLIIAPTMESGPKAQGLMKYNDRIDREHERLISLMTAVYSRAIEEGILTVGQIKEEGVSAYIGTSPCNQVSNGLFMRLNGQIQLCPGRSDEGAVYGSVHNSPIAKIWLDSPNYQRADLTNNWCAAKTNGMPKWLQAEVLARLEQKYHGN